MAKTITGVVEKVFVKNGNTALLIDGTWYGAGKGKVNVEDGQEVTFEVEYNGKYANVARGTLRTNSAPASEKSAAPAVKAADGRQQAIHYQSSRKDAIEVAQAAVTSGFVTPPTKKADQLEWFLALVDNLTDRFFNDCESVAKNGTRDTQEKEDAPQGADIVDDDIPF